MKKLLEKRTNPLFAVLVAFMLGYFLVNDLDLRYIYVYAVLGIILLVSFFLDGVIRPGMKLGEIVSGVLQRITPMKACFLFMVLVVTVYSVLPSSDKDHEVISTTISMLLLSVYVLFSAPKERTVMRAFTAIHVVAVVFSVYIIIVRIHPDFYWNDVYPHLGSYTQERAAFLMPLGYGVPIGGSTSYGVYVITIAFFINFVRMLISGGIQKFREIVLTVASTVLYLTAILLVNRRSEMLTLIATAAVLFVIYLVPKGKKEWRIKLQTLGSTAVLMVLVVSLLAQAGHLGRYFETIEALKSDSSTTVVTDPTNPNEMPTSETEAPTIPAPESDAPKSELSHGRFVLWKCGIELFLENPVQGVGWMQFRNNSDFGEDYVHNTYIQWLCETGVIGFLLIFTPIMFMIFMTFKQTLRFARKQDEISYELRLINKVALAMNGYFLALNLVDPTFYHLYFFVFYSFVIVLADAALGLESTEYARSDIKCIVKNIWKNTKLF